MQQSFRLQLTATVILVTLPLAASAQEWTRFRGPNGSGQSEATGIPAQWSESDYNWTAELPGEGHSSPVVWGDKIFLLSADPEDATRHALCLGAEDGNILWKRSFPFSAICLSGPPRLSRGR